MGRGQHGKRLVLREVRGNYKEQLPILRRMLRVAEIER